MLLHIIEESGVNIITLSQYLPKRGVIEQVNEVKILDRINVINEINNIFFNQLN